MENLFSMIEGTKSSEITTIERINQETMQNLFLNLLCGTLVKWQKRNTQVKVTMIRNY